MASESRIKFSLFSSFKGKGFDEAEKSLKKISSTTDKAHHTMSGAISELSKMDGQLGNVARSVGQVSHAFAQLGMVGGIIAAAQIAIDSWTEKMKQAADKLVSTTKANAERMMERLKNTIQRHLQGLDDDMQNTVKTVDVAIAKLDALAQRQSRISQANAQLDIAKGNKTISDIQIEKLNAMIHEETDAGKALVAAKYDVKIAEEKYAQAISQGEAARKKAEHELELADMRKIELESKIAVAQEHLNKALEEEANASVLDEASRKQFTTRREAAEKEVENAQKDFADATTAVEVAEKTLEAVIIQTTQRREEANAQITQTKNAEKKLEDAANERAEKLKEKAVLEDELFDQQKNFGEAIRKANDAIKQAQDNLANIDKAQERTQKGIQTDLAKHQGIGGAGYKWQLDENGNPTSLKDWQRAQRYAERAERDAKKAERAGSANQKKLAELEEKQRKGKYLSDDEKKKLDNLRKWDNEKNGKQREEEKLRKAQADKEKLEREQAEAVKDIRDKLDKLGLK